MTSGGLPDHYAALGVTCDADEATIKKSYRKNVLLWHPDKHPSEPEFAEDKIRQINVAYETLSNPQKRSQYDHQRVALEQRTQGLRMDTTLIKPRMSIPKEFMLCPMGFPDKFVRFSGTTLFVQSREDCDAPFQEFFESAKFSLWWLPQKNNMCHLRAQASAGQGVRGGMNMSFTLAGQLPNSEVMLSPIQEPQTFLVVTPSPEYQGAFRFEAAFFSKYFLVFKQPTHLQIMSSAVDGALQSDFMLVDYASMFKYMTPYEAFSPVVDSLGDSSKYVSIEAIREDHRTRHYFQTVMRKPVWSKDDFETYFTGHYQDWDVDPATGHVRVRSRREKLLHALRKAKSPREIAAAVSVAGNVLNVVPVQTAQTLVEVLGQPLSDEGDVSACINYVTAQKSILAALPNICRSASLVGIVSIYSQMKMFGGGGAGKDIIQQRNEIGKILAQFASKLICSNNSTELTPEMVSLLCSMPLDWAACGGKLRSAVAPVLAQGNPDDLLVLLRSSVKASASSMVEEIIACIADRIGFMGPTQVAEAICLTVSAGFHWPCAASTLMRIQKEASFEVVLAGVASLGEKGAEDSELKLCACTLAEQRARWQNLPHALLLRLTVAATKSAAIAEGLIATVAAACACMLDTWSMDDVAKLLLAVAKAKCEVHGAEVSELFARATVVVTPRLPKLSPAHLIKIVLSLGRAPAGQVLLDAAAREALKRVADFPFQQLLLLTQGFLALEATHFSIDKVLEFWASKLAPNSPQACIRQQGLIHEALKPNSDQLLKLLQILTAAVPRHTTCEVIARALACEVDSLNESAHALLESFLSDKMNCEFKGKDLLLQALGRAKETPNEAKNPAVKRRRRSSSSRSSRAYHRRRRSYSGSRYRRRR